MADVHFLVAEHLSIINANNFGAARNAATINLALAAIGGANRILEIPNTDLQGDFATWTINANVTVPTNVVLRHGPHSPLSINAGSTWTQNGPVWAGPYQIWDTTPGGTLVYNAPGIRHDQWDGGTALTNAPINTGAFTSDRYRLTAGPGRVDFSAAPGNPEGFALGSPGDQYTNPDPPASLWWKESGVATVNGWILVARAVDVTALEARATALEARATALEDATSPSQVIFTPGAGLRTDLIPAVFPAGTIAGTVASEVTVTFAGITGIRLGDPDEGEDIWAPLVLPMLGATSTPADNIATPQRLYSPTPRAIKISAIGGTFDGLGTLQITPTTT